MKRRMLLQWGSGTAVAGATPAVFAAPPQAAGVAVAASLQNVMAALLPPFSQVTGHQLNLTFGASGNLATQIEQGLPVELFLSADEEFAQRVARSGWARDPGVVYATGRLALVVARGPVIGVDARLQGLKRAWPAVRRFAIANPQLAPYGRAAQEVLDNTGLLPQARGRLVIGENVAQAAQFVATGSAQAGLTALSLVVGREEAGWRAFAEVDAGLHSPLRQRMVLRRQAGAAATAFYDYLQRAPAQAVLRSHGFG